jgi:hypothetical protein
VATCKIYEIQGRDPKRTAGALRCLRDATDNVEVDGVRRAICEHHQDGVWHLFVNGAWVFAISLDASTS